MTKKINETKRVFEEKLAEYEQKESYNNKLFKRLSDAKENIVSLEEEKNELYEKRPLLLADNEDVSGINQRLKDIDDEIELNNETIKGVKIKQKTIHNELLYIRQDTNKAYKNYIEEHLEKLKKEYMKIAPKFAELITDYMVLEALRDGNGYNNTDFKYDQIREIPSLIKNSKTLFSYNYYEMTRNNKDRVINKYNIQDYYVRNVSINDFIS